MGQALSAAEQSPPETWSHTPTQQPPPGVIPNFVNPESREYQITIVCVVMIAATVPCITLRWLVKSMLTKNIGIDDWLALVAFVMTLFWTLWVLIVNLGPGLGPHLWNVPLSTFVDPGSNFLWRGVVGVLLYPISAYFVKLSMLLFYRRWFVPPYVGPGLWVVRGGVLCLTVAYAVPISIVGSRCGPKPNQFDVIEECILHNWGMSWTIAAINIISDIFILAIPFLYVPQLEMDCRRKAGVLFVFLLGIGATIASVLSLYTRVALLQAGDFSWNLVPPTCYSVAEVNLGLMCSCLPAMNALLQRRDLVRKRASSRWKRLWFGQRDLEGANSDKSSQGSVTIKSAEEGSEHHLVLGKERV